MKGILRGVYRGKRVLVTGHTGFKGAWLSMWLEALGAEVTGYALAPATTPNLFRAVGLDRRINHVLGDVRDGRRLAQVMRRFRPQIVFHLAAQSLVRRSYADPVFTMESNVLGTVNLLEAVRQTDGVRVCVVITSDKCYENREWTYAYRENDPLGGRDPYSASKGCAELVTAAYRASFFGEGQGKRGTAISTVRAGNVIGGGDWAADRLVPDCVRSLSRGQSIVVRNPQSVRPWQFVLDPLSGYLQLGQRMWQDGPTFSGAWNFGPQASDAVTVGDLVRRVVDLWGEGTVAAQRTRRDRSAAPHEAGLLRLDCAKAHHYLKWHACYSLRETLAETVAWYRGYHRGQRGDALLRSCLAQIEAFVAAGGSRGLAWTQGRRVSPAVATGI